MKKSKNLFRIMGLESEHKVFVADRKSLVEKMTRGARTLKEMREAVQKLQQDMRDCFEQYESLADKMSKNTANSNATKELLDEIREQIAILTRPCIVVYADGKIESENLDYFPEVFDETVFNKLLHTDEAEVLTIRELKALARVRAIVDNLSHRGIDYQLEFENKAAMLKI